MVTVTRGEGRRGPRDEKSRVDKREGGGKDADIRRERRWLGRGTEKERKGKGRGGVEGARGREREKEREGWRACVWSTGLGLRNDACTSVQVRR